MQWTSDLPTQSGLYLQYDVEDKRLVWGVVYHNGTEGYYFVDNACKSGGIPVDNIGGLCVVRSVTQRPRGHLMYAVFLNFNDQQFAVVGVFADDEVLPPGPPNEWEPYGTEHGFTDTMAYVRTVALGFGWRNFTVTFDNIHRD